jgi:hypothetical protein
MVVGSGDIIKEKLLLTDFEDVSSSISAEIEIKQNDTFSVIVEGQKNIIDLLDITVEIGGLKIRFKNGYNVNYQKLKIYVEAPKFASLKMSGSGSLESTGNIKCADLDVILSGSADVNIQKLKANNLTVKVSGSGDVEIGGDVGNSDFTVSGSGNIDAKNCVSENVDCRISGSGDVKFFVNDALDVRISGSGDVKYYGNPTIINKKITGSGSVKQKI